jgi:DoxX-like family
VPEAAQAFTRLGFPTDYFRVELSWAKVAGVAALLIPMVPARLKEWAYAGFAINLTSALIAHFSIGDALLGFIPSTLSSVLWALSYNFWRRLQATPMSA